MCLLCAERRAARQWWVHNLSVVLWGNCSTPVRRAFPATTAGARGRVFPPLLGSGGVTRAARPTVSVAYSHASRAYAARTRLCRRLPATSASALSPGLSFLPPASCRRPASPTRAGARLSPRLVAGSDYRPVSRPRPLSAVRRRWFPPDRRLFSGSPSPSSSCSPPVHLSSASAASAGAVSAAVRHAVSTAAAVSRV